ncbi:glycosyltransferase family 4 protein [Gillisia hiemivivida]|uniref:Glycosyltransferase family 4 protein n=2 Tax=Gillisia hiemivivida TaxID=291190 RepID=A0A5C6ZU79_9FLAO|nr:glycosyltransferase family 4 protein [Gillisia hiemivivida]
MVSIFSNHFFRWTEQLRDSGHEVYWIDVYDSNTHVKKIDFVHQIIGWRNKIKYPGRYWIKQNSPKLYKFINRINQRKLAQIFESKLSEIRPDVVHSFVMYSACVPIYKVMKKYPTIKWIYSAWGNDLFFYQNENQKLQDMKLVLPELDYMFADCVRDFKIAKKHGFQGEFLGAYPGGGGYEFELYEPFLKPYTQRKIILIKGYEHKFGRCNKVLKAIDILKEELSGFNIVVFGANDKVLNFVKKNRLNEWENLIILEKLSHSEVLKLMGESLIYIGDSISDGMPNTLLEAIVMEAFPIQSNPGGATAELISHKENGLLIEYPEDFEEIAKHISYALIHLDKVQEGIAYNNKEVKPKLERNFIKKLVLIQYEKVALELKNNND